MGAFFLYKNNSDINQEQARSIFREKGFNHYRELSFADYSLIIYPKIALGDKFDNLYICGNNLIFSFGTPLYKNFSYKEVLKNIYDDFSRGELSFSDLNGYFCIMIWAGEQLYFINDSNNNCRVYVNTATFSISSSFLAQAETFNKELTVNKQNVITNLISGCSYGKVTCFNEIELTNIDFNSEIYSEINYLSNNPFAQSWEKSWTNVNECVTEQIDVNLRFLQQIKTFTGGANSVDIGLSGGYDSRLLLLLSDKIFDNISLHSNYKKNPDTDILVSREIAGILGKGLKEVPVTTSVEMDESELAGTLRQSFLFYDGQFRVNHGWTRQYRTLDYRKAVLGGCLTALSGHNGEQYRNLFYFNQKKRITIEKFVKDYIFEGKLGLVTDKESRETIYDFWCSFFKNALTNNSDQKVGIKDLRKFYTDFWVMAGPGIRCSAENQLSFFIMPFMEYEIIKSSETIIPYLGLYGEFESKMITALNPMIADIKSNYGYSFSGIKFTQKLYWYLRTISGLKLKNLYKLYFKNSVLKRERISFDFKFLYKLDLPINWNKLINLDEDSRDRIIALNYLMNHFKYKIKF